MWLKVDRTEQALKMTWGNAEGPCKEIYHISPDAVEEASIDINAALTALAGWHKTRAASEKLPLLQSLAEAGARLRFHLFRAPTEAVAAKKVHDWYLEQFLEGDRDLRILADPSLHIPWTLVWEGDEQSAQRGTSDLEDFDRFWGHRFELSQLFNEGRKNRLKAVPRDNFRLLSAFHRRMFDQIRNDISEGEWATMARLYELPEGPVFRKAALRENMRKAAETNALVYLYGHTEAQHRGPRSHHQFVLDDNETITVSDLEMMLDSLIGQPERNNALGSLLFLNACETILDNGQHSYRNAAAVPGICGIIATEAEVPRDFAAKYAARLLNLLVLEGKPIGSAIRSLRLDKDLWPGSLFYNCYAPPNYRIEAPKSLVD